MFYCKKCKIKIQNYSVVESGGCFQCDKPENMIELDQKLESIFLLFREKNYPLENIFTMASMVHPIQIRFNNFQFREYLPPLPPSFSLVINYNSIELFCSVSEVNEEKNDDEIFEEVKKELIEWIETIPKIFFLLFHFNCPSTKATEKLTHSLLQNDLAFNVTTDVFDDNSFFVTASRYILPENEKPEIAMLDSLGKEAGADDFLYQLYYSY